MIYRMLVAFAVIFTLSGCFHVSSGTKIVISDVSTLEYKDIKRKLRNKLIHMTPAFDCNSNESYWKNNRNNGQLICNNGLLYTKMNGKTVNIFYAGGSEFWIPTKMIITNEHKQIQELFLEIGEEYKEKYEDVKVIFYHQDLPKNGKLLKIEN